MRNFTFLITCILYALTLSAQTNILPFGSSWKYLDNGSDQKTAWRSPAFNDAGWKPGNAKFGYGVKDAVTQINYGTDSKNKYITTYFRKSISITDPTSFNSYAATIVREDAGVIVYVNGLEVFRNNMPTEAINYKTQAANKEQGVDGKNDLVFTLPGNTFIAGSNVIAVGIHLKRENSHSMAFDMNLIGHSAIVDKTAPVVQSISRQSPASADITNAASLIFRTVFSEKVTGVTTSDFSVTTVSGTASGTPASVTAVGTDGKTYDITVSSVSSQGVLRLDLKETGTNIFDEAGNEITNGFTGGQTYNIDRVAPVIQSVNRQSPTDATTSASSVTYRVTFSEVVSGVDAGDFSLTVTSGSLSGTVKAVTAQDGTSYDVTVEPISGSGVVRLDLKASATGIQDEAGNAINGGYVTGETYAITQSIPTLTSVGISSNNSNPSLAKVGDVVTLSFTASEAINTPTVSIATRNVNVVAVSGNSFTATYTMSAEDAEGVVPFSISFTSSAGNAGSSVSVSTNGSTVSFDKTVPAVTSIVRQEPTTESTTAANVTFRATFSEKVSGVDAADFAATAVSGSVSGTVSNVAAVGTDGTTYDVTVSSITGSGVLRLDLNNSTGIADEAGNASNAGFTGGESFIIEEQDLLAPTVTSISRQSPTTETTTATTVTFRAIFSEKVLGVDVSDFSIVTVSGSVSGTLASNAVAAVGTDGTTFDITVSSITGMGTLRLDIKNAGTGIIDGAGNVMTSGFAGGETYAIEEEPVITYGFTSITPLTALPISSETKDKPQAKAWKYAGKWWCVLPYKSNGVMILRLDGTSWTNTLTIRATEDARADCRVVGDLVHILLYKGAGQNSSLTTVQYDPASNKYKMWGQRPENVTLVFPANSETATLVIDTKGRMWVASDGRNNDPNTVIHEVTVRWSDAPYTTWSEPIVIASGVKDDDICTLTAIPNQGKIGVFWSNQNTKRFGFRTHADGDEPNNWAADEVPAYQSAVDNVGLGMADDHMNINVASDGTMYCAVKTGYNTDGSPQVSMLVRRPSGAWDPLYPVTFGNGSGTQPMVVLNEAKGKVKIVYTTVEGGGDIVYKESPISKISFGDQKTLISGGGYKYNYATSTHQTYDPEIVILATKYVTSTTWEAVGVLASDDPAALNAITALPSSASLQMAADQRVSDGKTSLLAYPNPFTSTATLSFTLQDSGEYSLSLFDMKGSKVSVIKRGQAEAGQLNTVSVNGTGLSNGIYFVRLETVKGTQTLKMIYKK